MTEKETCSYKGGIYRVGRRRFRSYIDAKHYIDNGPHDPPLWWDILIAALAIPVIWAAFVMAWAILG